MEWGLNRGESSPVRATFARLQASGGTTPHERPVTATELADAAAKGAQTADDVRRIVHGQRAD